MKKEVIVPILSEDIQDRMKNIEAIRTKINDYRRYFSHQKALRFILLHKSIHMAMLEVQYAEEYKKLWDFILKKYNLNKSIRSYEITDDYKLIVLRKKSLQDLINDAMDEL